MKTMLHFAALGFAGGAYFNLAVKHGGCYWLLLLYPCLEILIVVAEGWRKNDGSAQSEDVENDDAPTNDRSAGPASRPRIDP